MNLKVRFSLFFSTITVGLILLFAFFVYRQVHFHLLQEADSFVAAHLEHEWHHLESSGPKARLGTLPTRDIFQKVVFDGSTLVDSLPKDERPTRAKTERRLLSGHTYDVTVALDLGPRNTYLKTLRDTLFVSCLGSLLLLLPASYFFSQALLRPFRQLASQTRKLSAGQLGFRFPLPSHQDEYGLLVQNFNELLARLEQSFDQIKRFAINASHELRTPLTVIRGEVELALRKTRSEAEYQRAFQKILRNAETLRNIISQLLQLADLENPGGKRRGENAEIDAILTEVGEALRPRFEESGKKLTIEQGDRISASTYPELWYSIIGNLLENALRHAQYEVRAQLSETQGRWLVTVEDDGPGIPEDKWELVFEPFFKDSSPEGHGMGLSIVKASVAALKGTISLGVSQLGGLKVRVTIPPTS